MDGPARRPALFRPSSRRMATLTRTRASSTNHSPSSHALTRDVPKPFPTRAEREQAELLDSLASEDLQLEDAVELTSTIPPSFEDTGKSEGELLPSINNLQTSCLTTLNDLLSSTSIPEDDNVLAPSSSNQSQLSEGADDSTLLQELRTRVEHVAPTLSSRDADLANALLSILSHFHTLSSFARSGTSRPVSQLRSATPPEALPSTSSANPLRHLRRHVSDFQLERSSRPDSQMLGESSTPVRTVQAALLWTQIDDQLEHVLSLCRSSFDDSSSMHLPPRYDPEDYDRGYEVEGLPQYERGDYQERSGKSLDKGSSSDSAAVSPTMSFASTSEKMRMDLEAVTHAIDRLYEVAPQLHNQRVELKKTKVEQMAKASRDGKRKQVEAPPDERDLEKMLELIGRASERKITDQSVVMTEDMRTRMARYKERDRLKRAAFVEELVKHSGAGRMDSQDATFSVSSTPRSSSATKMQDPNALLTLPEFIREAVPEAVNERMHMKERISLPDFVKEPIPQQVTRARHSRIQSVSVANEAAISESDSADVLGTSRPSSKTGKPKNHRSRSLSAPPLAWLLSNGPTRPTSPAKASRTSRPGSSHARLPSLEVGLDVSYVAENHENLRHILVFLTVSGAASNLPVEAEVVARENPDELPRLVVRCGTSSSSQLELPAHVVMGKKEVRLVGEDHYEIKLHAPSSSRPQSRPGSPPSTEIESASIMDATYFSTTQPTSFICTSCSLPLVHASQVSSYRDLPSEHWAELVDAWMCHSDMKLHEHVKKNSKDGFWPEAREALVGGSYVLVQEEVVLRGNIREPKKDAKDTDEWMRVRCMCGAVVGRCQEHASEGKPPVWVYRLIKYAFRPVTPGSDPVRVPLSAFIVEDMNEFVQAHATYRFVILDDDEERPRILIWLFKPNMRLSYTTPSPYSMPKSGTVRAAKILFKLLGPSTPSFDLST
ncbi:hypothetical protein EIP91_002058 [Steccherinum ochraceum]|uniref:Uncharacterized protein n=1 Tax=Steccherinum ochraceum TaxID=92696 RepID=A0A4R0RTH6_9APHY|nr:hypothetical protein EIP91_002058 [Steccherinum ochraceum]